MRHSWLRGRFKFKTAGNEIEFLCLVFHLWMSSVVELISTSPKWYCRKKWMIWSASLFAWEKIPLSGIECQIPTMLNREAETKDWDRDYSQIERKMRQLTKLLKKKAKAEKRNRPALSIYVWLSYPALYGLTRCLLGRLGKKDRTPIPSPKLDKKKEEGTSEVISNMMNGWLFRMRRLRRLKSFSMSAYSVSYQVGILCLAHRSL